jgi:N-acylglucosamine-6-phosphate 2-epimerase
MIEVLEKIKGGMIISCQSEGNDPFNSPSGVTLFAKAAQMAGAAAIRSQGLAKIRMIIKNVPLPMIGLLKGKFNDGTVKITGSFKQVEQLLNTGCDINRYRWHFQIERRTYGTRFYFQSAQKIPKLCNNGRYRHL